MTGFLGPWFCSLFFNTSLKCKKQTHLEAHTYPHLTVDVLNKGLYSGDDQNCWTIILKIGPFTEWSGAQKFRDLWIAHTRGKLCRLQRGVFLFKAYAKDYNLKMWAQSQMRDLAIKDFFEERQEPPQEKKREFTEQKAHEIEHNASESFSFDALFHTTLLEEITMGAIDERHSACEKSIAKKRKIKR